MTLNLWHLCLFGIAAFILASLFLISSPNLSAAPTLQSSQVQSSFSQPSYNSGDTAILHVTDPDLDTLLSCTATVGRRGSPTARHGSTCDTAWNILNWSTQLHQRIGGAGAGCAYISRPLPQHHSKEFPELGNSSMDSHGDRTGARSSRLTRSQMSSTMSGNVFLGDTALSAYVSSTSTVSIPFYFHGQNSYPASAQRVKVTSVADYDRRMGVAC